MRRITFLSVLKHSRLRRHSSFSLRLERLFLPLSYVSVKNVVVRKCLQDVVISPFDVILRVKWCQLVADNRLDTLVVRVSDVLFYL